MWMRYRYRQTSPKILMHKPSEKRRGGGRGKLQGWRAERKGKRGYDGWKCLLEKGWALEHCTTLTVHLTVIQLKKVKNKDKRAAIKND